MFSGFGGLQYYEDDVKITKAEVNQHMQKNEITNMYWSKSKRHYNISLAAFGAQIVTSYFALASLNNSSSLSNRSWAFFAASIGAGAISFGYSLSSASLKKKAILGYNKLQEEGLTYHRSDYSYAMRMSFLLLTANALPLIPGTS